MIIIKRKVNDKIQRISEYYVEFNEERIIIARSEASGLLWQDRIMWEAESLRKIFKTEILICSDKQFEKNFSSYDAPINPSETCHFHNKILDKEHIKQYLEDSMQNYAKFINSDLEFKRLTRATFVYYLFEKVADNEFKVVKKRKAINPNNLNEIEGLILLFYDNSFRAKDQIEFKEELSKIKYISGNTYELSYLLIKLGFKYNKNTKKYENTSLWIKFNLLKAFEDEYDLFIKILWEHYPHLKKRILKEV